MSFHRVLPSSLRRALVLSVGLVVAASAADSGAREGFGRRFAAARGAPRAAAARPAPRPEPVAAPVEASPEAPAARGERPGRLTPDERRALRQQINDAGRDLYRPNRP